MKHRWRVTKGGWVIVAILAACVVLVTVAGGTVRFLAAAAGGLILLTVVGGGLNGARGSSTDYERKAEVLRDDSFGRVDDR